MVKGDWVIVVDTKWLSALEDVTQIPPAIFRAYDVRGQAGTALCAQWVYHIALAIGTQAGYQGKTRFVVGRDARLSSPALFLPLCQGLVDAGVHVVDVGILPTPVLYFSMYHLNCDSLVMLTASHNPASDNGLKVVIGRQTLTGGQIAKLRDCIIAKQCLRQTTGSITQKKGMIDCYITHRVNLLQIDRTAAADYRIVIDAAHGVAGLVAPRLFRALGFAVSAIRCCPDGRFPDHPPDPTVPRHLARLIRAVKRGKAQLGLAFDGDGDRLGVVTETGEIIWPDRQLMLFAQAILLSHPGGKVVFDVKCSAQLAQVIEQAGGVPCLWKTGHSFIKSYSEKQGAVLAGEFSGHLFFPADGFCFDDGLYAGARLLSLLLRKKQAASVVFKSLPCAVSTPEYKLPIAEEDKAYFMHYLLLSADFPGAILSALDGIRIAYPDG